MVEDPQNDRYPYNLEQAQISCKMVIATISRENHGNFEKARPLSC